MDYLQLATDERADLLSLLTDLRPDEWNSPSLCQGWRVRDVAAHVISYDLLSPVGTAALFLRGGLSVRRINQIGVDKAKRLSIDVVLEQIRSHPTPTGLTSGFKGGIGLTDGLVHQQDIRRALDKPRKIAPERTNAALSFALKAPTLNGRTLTRGLLLVATDQAWRAGQGPEVHGTAEALLMAIAGRPAALAELAGEGLPTLQHRLTG